MGRQVTCPVFSVPDNSYRQTLMNRNSCRSVPVRLRSPLAHVLSVCGVLGCGKPL